MDVFKSSFTTERKVVVLHCVPLVCTWMDDELMVSIDAVVHGELVVNRADLMQYACHPEQPLRPLSTNLLADLAISVLEAGLVLV